MHRLQRLGLSFPPWWQDDWMGHYYLGEPWGFGWFGWLAGVWGIWGSDIIVISCLPIFRPSRWQDGACLTELHTNDTKGRLDYPQPTLCPSLSWE